MNAHQSGTLSPETTRSSSENLGSPFPDLRFLSDALQVPAEPVFDRIVSLLRAQCEVPYALVSLAETQGQWFRSVSGGLPGRVAPLGTAFCATVAREARAVFIEDARADARFRDDVSVAGPIGLRFYAGVPVRRAGQVVGVLCMMDVRPRVLSVQQEALLLQLSDVLAEIVELRRRASEEAALATLLDAAVEEAWLFDLESERIVRASTGALRRTGIAAAALGTMRPSDLAPAYALPRLLKARERLRAGERGVYVEAEHPSAEGGQYPVEMRLVRARLADGLSERLLVAVGRNIAARKAAERELAYRAHHDNLTGLANRYLFEDRFEAARRRLTRSGAGLGLILIDLDGFKEVNDTWGHGAGDEVLVAVARALERCARDSDTPARLGGDEFVLLLDGIGSEAELDGICWRLAMAIETLQPAGLPPGLVGASMGTVFSLDPGSALEALLETADARMYSRKRAGR